MPRGAAHDKGQCKNNCIIMLHSSVSFHLRGVLYCKAVIWG